uniref:Chromosome 8 open reading frame 58 n=1 Tax=Otolemur garnettii TaxID=30611 RepID=H0XVF4_OTOGA
MLGRRRVFAVDGRDGAVQGLARGCVVPGVTSTYRRIPDVAPECSSDSWQWGGELRSVGRQVPLLKLASRDSGVEMAVGDSLLATLPGLSQDSLDFEPLGSPELPTQQGRFLASHKLEQMLERSHRLPTGPASLSGRRSPFQPPSKPECEVPLYGAGKQESSEVHVDGEASLEATEVVEGPGPEAWTCLPGQGLRYLEHLCLVLEQMARLQQLYLQLQSQRPPGDPEEEELAVAPSPSPSQTSSNQVQRPWELRSQTEESGTKAASPPKVGMPNTSHPKLAEAPVEPTHNFPCSQGHKQDVSHWDKVKVLLNRIRWRSHQQPEPPAPPGSSGLWIEPRNHLPDRPQSCIHRKTFMPSLVVKKQRAKNLSVC